MPNKQQDDAIHRSSGHADGESAATRADRSTMAKIDDARKGRSAKIARSVIEAVNVGGPSLQVLQLAQGLAGSPAKTEPESKRDILE